jgi:sarcosine oxidase, subunit gamma
VAEPGASQPAPMVGSHFGVEAYGVVLAEVITTACWNVQGDSMRGPFAAEFERHFGLATLPAANTAARGERWTALWLGPRSWLLCADPRLAVPTPDAFIATRDALNLHGGALFDLSAARVGFAIGGAHAASVLAKSCPLDLHPDAFAGGSCAQSVLGPINILLYRPEATAMFVLMAARSLAGDVWRTLCQSAAQYGVDVLPPVVFGENLPNASAA